MGLLLVNDVVLSQTLVLILIAAHPETVQLLLIFPENVCFWPLGEPEQMLWKVRFPISRWK